MEVVCLEVDLELRVNRKKKIGNSRWGRNKKSRWTDLDRLS